MLFPFTSVIVFFSSIHYLGTNSIGMLTQFTQIIEMFDVMLERLSEEDPLIHAMDEVPL